MSQCDQILVLMGFTLVLALGCSERTVAADGGDLDGAEQDTGESGGVVDFPTCEGPDAPSEPVLLVEGDMLPRPFVRVGARMYWADGWDEWGEQPPSVTLYRTQLDQPESWVPVATEQLGINQIVSDGEFVYWIVDGLEQPAGKLLRAGPDDTIELLDDGLDKPQALTLGEGGEWVYYADGGYGAGGRILRIRPDGADRQLLAETNGRVTDVAVDDQYLWWTIAIDYEVWRVNMDGGDPELVGADVYYPVGVELGAGFAWTVGLSGLSRIEPGVPPYFVDGANGPYELAVTDTHLYLTFWNFFEDTHLGWIHRYPIMAGEYDPLAGEFVIPKASPKPSAVRTDSNTIYWATADEELGEGAIWMLCESAL